MTEQQMLVLAGAFLAGLVLGVIAMLISNKVSGGSTSPRKIKQDMEDYQMQVENHFDETSKKFKDMAVQYQDLYTHLAEGATTLCRPESAAHLLTADEKDPLKKNRISDSEAKNSVNQQASKEPATQKQQDQKTTATDIKADAGVKQEKKA